MFDTNNLFDVFCKSIGGLMNHCDVDSVTLNYTCFDGRNRASSRVLSPNVSHAMSVKPVFSLVAYPIHLS